MNRLKRNYWPGNVRELEQVITRHALIEDNPILKGDPALFADMIFSQTRATIDKCQKAQKALTEAGYNKTKAALALGISRKTLYQWLKPKDQNSDQK